MKKEAQKFKLELIIFHKLIKEKYNQSQLYW